MKCKFYSEYKKKECGNDSFYIEIDGNCMKIYCTICGHIEIRTVV